MNLGHFTRSRRNQVSALALSLSLLFLLAACGGGPDSDGNSGQVRGLVLEVVGRDISEVETLRLRDEDGEVWTFTTEGFVGFTPSHLREHQVFGHDVQVSYRQEGDRLIATNITD